MGGIVTSALNAYTVQTSQGQIALWDSKAEGTPVIFLHGNSACYQVWEKQFCSELAKKYRFVAIDLPGHGKSDKPKDYQTTYSYQGYAMIINEVISSLGLQKPIVVAWSLSAYVAFAYLNMSLSLAGLMITGASPIPFNKEGKLDMERAFNQNPRRVALLAKEELTHEDAHEFVRSSGFNPTIVPFMLEAALKTDGHARSCIIQNRNDGKGCCDCKQIVETSELPFCVVAGEKDPVLKLRYLRDEINYKNLFKGQVFVIDDAGHAAFWDQPEKFNRILFEFLGHIDNHWKHHQIEPVKN